MSTNRGSSLFSELFAPAPVVTEKRKGRSDLEISRRNELLFHRYFFIGSSTRLSYDAVVEQLQREFFLSNFTIKELLQDNADKIRLIKTSNPSVVALRKRWPHVNWSLLDFPLDLCA